MLLMLRKALLVSGVLSSLLYVAMTAFVPMQWERYSSVSQTVSELSAIGAPTRPVWVPLGTAYTLLVAAFGWGVLASARRNRPLRVAEPPSERTSIGSYARGALYARYAADATLPLTA